MYTGHKINLSNFMVIIPSLLFKNKIIVNIFEYTANCSSNRDSATIADDKIYV